MPVPSFFKRKASSSKSSDAKPKQKPKPADIDDDDADKSKPTAASNSVFSGDENLLQLHAETTELLRLVKTPAKAKSSTSAKRHGSPVKKRPPVRQTIEVLENDDDEQTENDQDKARKQSAASVSPAQRPSSSASLAPVDPFAFDAEEARVRKARDTFLPDTSPSKRDVERQRGHLASEQSRLQRIETSDEMRQQHRRYEAETRQPVVDRVQDSATVIQAHSRGFLARKQCEKEKQRLVAEAQREQQQQEAMQWHEVRDVAKNEVWFYNAVTGQSQWERPAVMAIAPPPTASSQGAGCAELPAIQPSTGNASTSSTATSPMTGHASVLARAGLSSSSSSSASCTDLPPLSPSTSRPNSSSSNCGTTVSASSRPQSSTKRATLSSSTPLLPSLTTTTTTSSPRLPFEYGACSVSSRPWECDSVAGSSSDQMSLCSERLEDHDDDGHETLDFSRGRRSQLQHQHQLPYENAPDDNDGGDDDWQVNDSLFLADGSKNSKLRDTIRSALQTSKFDSVSSLIASNVVLRKKPQKGRRDHQLLVPDAHDNHPNQQRTATGAAVGSSPSRSREIVLGRRDAPLFVAVLDTTRQRTATSTTTTATTTKKPTTKRRPPPTSAAIGSDPSNPLAATPQILDLVDPGLYEGLDGSSSSSSSPNKKAISSPGKSSALSTPSTVVCFNCWSSSNGRHCDAHQDASDFRKVKSAESALMCANWNLDQLRKKYRSEEIQEIFMKQNASLRYDKRLKQYVTVIEAKHPIYRLSEQLTTAWNKTMRRKIHTRAWFRSFIEQLRAGGVPKADASTPKLMKLKNTLQNHRWCAKYSDTVREFHPRAPVTAKTHNGTIGSRTGVVPDVIMVDPAHPQLANWMLTTDWTKPVALYKPRKYELPPRRCVPMPTPSFLEEIPLPVPNLFIDCGHVASWFERLSARVAIAAIHKALLQIQACSPPRGATDARKTKHVTPVTVLFATFGRKPTTGMLAVGGLSAELLIHMLVTTYIPAQYGHFIVFDRRVVAPLLTKDYDATFVCLEIDPITMSYIFRALEHALNVRRPPCIVVSTRLAPGDPEAPGSHEMDANRFPDNRPDQTGEELAHGFRTYWLVEAFLVPDDVDGVAVQPTADVLSANTTSMNATMTTKVDRFYPFCIPTTKENTPIEFIHLLWIGQSSRNQPQTFTTLGAQQPGEFMKNSDPHGALGVCTSVVYRSWAYMQSSPFDEFTTDDGIAYWYDRQSGDTFWSRPVLPAEKHRGKDGDVDGVVVLGVGEVATLGVGVEISSSAGGTGSTTGGARYSQHDLRKYMTKKMEAPKDKAKRIQRVGASARKHELVVALGATAPAGSTTTPSKVFAKVQVPALEFHSSSKAKTKAAQQLREDGGGGVASSFSPVKSQAKSPQKSSTTSSTSLEAGGSLDASTKQLIATITQALGSAGGTANGSSGVDMLQLGIGLGMGLGLRSSQQQPNQRIGASSSRVRSSSRSNRSRPRSAESQVSFAEDDIDEAGDGGDYQEGGDEDEDGITTARSDSSSIQSDVSSTARSVLSVTVGPSPDELELLPEAERAKLLAQQLQRAGYNQKTPGYRTHAPPGEGHTWLDKPIDSSSESQTAVDGYGGSLHQRVACLPKDFVAAVSSTKTCAMQANYLPVIKNTNQPRSVGIVRPRAALDEWLSVGYSPWSAGRATFGTQFIKNLLDRPELLAAQTSGATTATMSPSTSSATSTSSSVAVQVEKKENVTQAVKEAQQLDTVFSLCRHGKYDELERMITSPDWTLAIDAMDVTGNTLLSIACQNNNKRIAKLCLRRGADLNTQNLNGQTVLHYCHEYGFHDLMDYLLDKGAKDDVVNADGLTCYEGLSKEAVDAI